MKKAKLTDDEIEKIAITALRSSIGGAGTDVSEARIRNMQYYNALPEGELAPPEIEDRSDFVATDVADTVNGLLPQLMRMFIGSDDAVTFEAREPGMEPQAKLATAYVNHQFYVRNDGVNVIHDWFKDSLRLKVGFAMVWAEEESEDAKQDYEGLLPEQLAMLLQDGWALRDDPEVDDDGLLTFSVYKESRRRKICVSSVPAHEMRIDVNARWDDEPAMVGRVFSKRRYEWEQDGYDVSGVGGTRSYRTDVESLLLLGETNQTTGEVAHESHELLQGAHIYIRLDADGDGIAEWVRICLIEDKLAVMQDGSDAWEQVDDHPFVWICPIPSPHSFFGDCPADYAIEPQRLRTNLVRLIEDNLRLSVNQRIYVNRRAGIDVDDLLDNRANGVVSGDGPMSEALSPIVIPDMSGAAYQLNEYIGSWAENRTGFNRYSAGTDQNALNKTKGGVELLTAKADMRTELIARFFGVGVRKLFAKILKLCIKHQNVVEMVKVGGQFVPINPADFRNDYFVKINVGLGNGSKEQQAARIMALMQTQLQAMPLGIVGPQHIAETVRLFVESQEFKNPERFVSPEPMGMPPNPQAFQQMQQQVQEQMQGMAQEIQRLEQENAQLKQANDDKSVDIDLKYAELGMKEREADLKESEVAHRQGMDMRKADFEESDPVREQAETENSAIEALAQAGMMMAQAAQAMAAAQMTPRAVSVALPDGRMITGQSAPVGMEPLSG